MAQTIGRLSSTKVASIRAPGYYADGGNLYLRIAPGGTRGWIFRFTVVGRTRDMGLGSYPEIGLAAARELAATARRLVKEGVDPIERRRHERTAQCVAKAKSLTFDECAREYIKSREVAWNNAKHRAQWSSTLASYASPVFGRLPVAEVDDGLVYRALGPIWNAKPETASRVRGRIESILDWAKASGYRSGENPARWKGHLEHKLPAASKVRRVKHHAALPYNEMGTFMVALRGCEDGAAAALELTILAAVRTNEAVRATWGEIDFDARTWTVPAERMKARKEHRVPLTTAMVTILEKLRSARVSEFVFSGGKVGRPLSDMALLMLLRRMGYGHITVHGFRSTFRDWAAERTSFPSEVVEMALAHSISNAVEAAYRRGDLFEKRRRLMEAWADYCAHAGTGAAVVPLRGRGAHGQTHGR